VCTLIRRRARRAGICYGVFMPVPLAGSEPLLVMAFDHRMALERSFGSSADTPGSLYVRFAAAKQIIWEATVQAAVTLTSASVGILVDEQYGAHVLNQGVRTEGITVCVPVERSLADLFDYEHGTDFEIHVDAVRPDVVKVLIFHNPDTDPERLATQADRLAALSRWCDERPYQFMLEVLVPPTEAQLAACGGSRDRYDQDVRPGLTLKAIEHLQAAGVAADYWKLEGMSEQQHVAEVIAACRANRPSATYLVLGRAAENEQVHEWLRTAASVEGAGGFAIGRSIWEGPITDYFEGRLDRAGVTSAIRATYLGFADTYLAAAGSLKA
jgi:myo-inositol catabolism protein IolC